MKVYQGDSSLLRIGAILRKKNPQKVLLLRDPRSYVLCGAAPIIESQLQGISVSFADIQVKIPVAEDIQAIADRIRRDSNDWLIAVGGGTVLDMAKAAAVWPAGAGNPQDIVSGVAPLAKKTIPKLLIPTTAGTGAEATPFAVVYIGKKKYSLVDPRMPGEYAILAPELTYSLPSRLTAETGCDALAQAIESYWSVRATAKSRAWSREALRLALNSLPAVVNHPAPGNRRAMLYAAHLAGRAIASARTTAAHSLSYPLTAHFGIPHGHAVMLTLPHFFPFFDRIDEARIQGGLTLAEVKRRFFELLHLLGAANGVEAREKLLALMDSLLLETRLSALGVGPEDLAIILAEGFTPDRMENHPLKISHHDGEAILGNIL